MLVILIGVLGLNALLLAVLFFSGRRYASDWRGYGDAGAYGSTVLCSDGGSSCALGSDGGGCGGGGGGGD